MKCSFAVGILFVATNMMGLHANAQEKLNEGIIKLSINTDVDHEPDAPSNEKAEGSQDHDYNENLPNLMKVLKSETSSSELKLDSIDSIIKLADAGDVDASLEAGKILFRGEVVPRDLNAAISYLESAATRGKESALFYLIDAYKVEPRPSNSEEKRIELSRLALTASAENIRYKGAVTLKDLGYYREALPELQKLSSAGNDRASSDIAKMSYYGQGVEVDKEYAFSEMEKLAEKRSVKDLETLIGWYRTSSHSQLPDALKRIDRLLDKHSDIITDDYMETTKVILNGRRSTTQSDYSDLAAQFETLTGKQKSTVLRALGLQQKNSYVYLVQSILFKNEIYNGKLTSTLNGSTISSINKYNLKNGIDGECITGPLSFSCIKAFSESIE